MVHNFLYLFQSLSDRSDKWICREHDDEKEYLVKWKELAYDECYWEFESDISAFQPEIERFNRLQSKYRKKSSSKQKSTLRDIIDSKKKQKEFQQFESSPDFLTGGMLCCENVFLLFGIWY